MKKCRDCKEEKPKEDFVKNKVFKDGIDTLCKVCNGKRVKAWRKRNPELRREQTRRELGKTYTRSKRLRFDYGITIEDYNDLFERQEGCCAICGTHQQDLTKALSVDHCHSSLQVRGLLCAKCNFMLGLANDNPIILKKAISYLEKTGY